MGLPWSEVHPEEQTELTATRPRAAALDASATPAAALEP